MTTRFYLGFAVALCVAVSLITFVLVTSEGCGADCETSEKTSLGCDALSERDMNPENEPVAPIRRRSLIERTEAGIPFGFNDSAFITGQVDLATTLRLHREVGSTIWRLPLDWGAVEANRGEFDFSSMDEIYCEAIDHGILPLVHLTGIPVWAAEPERPCAGIPCVQPPAAEHLPALAAFAERVAIRYPQLAAIEAWNEPNLQDFWPAPDPQAYVGLLAAIYTGAKAGDPNVPVLGGSVSAGLSDNPETGSLGLRTFFEGMAAAGGGHYMDAVSVHPYPTQPLGAPTESFTPAMAAARSIRDGAPRWPDRIWVTETGIATLPGSSFSTPVSEAEQERTLTGIYAQLSQAGDVDAVLFHTLVDPGFEVPGGPGFGWVATPVEGLTTKPVYCRFAEMTDLPTAGC